MKSLLVLLALIGTAYAEKFPTSGPCDDVESCEKQCAKNKKGTCYFGGVLVLQTVEEGRYAQAQRLFTSGCARGDAEACFQAANVTAHLDYKENTKNGPVTVAAYKRACDKNHARGCRSYAFYLNEDEKTKPRAAAIYKKAVELMAKKCLKGNMVEACNSASWSYESGEEVPKSPEKAAKLLAQLCKLDAKHYRCEKN